MSRRRSAIWMRRVLAIFGSAVALNYAWELAQAPFYEGVVLPDALWHCFVASVGDGVLVLVIFAAVCAAMRAVDWYLHPTSRSYLTMAIAGLAVAIAVEGWGLHVAERWQYSALMPVVPVLEVGAVPVLQMLLLPPLIFALARRLTR